MDTWTFTHILEMGVDAVKLNSACKWLNLRITRTSWLMLQIHMGREQRSRKGTGSTWSSWAESGYVILLPTLLINPQLRVSLLRETDGTGEQGGWEPECWRVLQRAGVLWCQSRSWGPSRLAGLGRWRVHAPSPSRTRSSWWPAGH